MGLAPLAAHDPSALETNANRRGHERGINGGDYATAAPSRRARAQNHSGAVLGHFADDNIVRFTFSGILSFVFINNHMGIAIISGPLSVQQQMGAIASLFPKPYLDPKRIGLRQLEAHLQSWVVVLGIIVVDVGHDKLLGVSQKSFFLLRQMFPVYAVGECIEDFRQLSN
jgi:hypothetical protein